MKTVFCVVLVYNERYKISFGFVLDNHAPIIYIEEHINYKDGHSNVLSTSGILFTFGLTGVLNMMFVCVNQNLQYGKQSKRSIAIREAINLTEGRIIHEGYLPYTTV